MTNVSPMRRKKDKRTKIYVRDLSYSVDHATSASEKVAAKMDNLIGLDVWYAKTCMKELLTTSRLKKLTCTSGCAHSCP